MTTNPGGWAFAAHYSQQTGCGVTPHGLVCSSGLEWELLAFALFSIVALLTTMLKRSK